MASLIEDPKKKKASFGDAAAAATDANVTQLNVGKPGDFPVRPDGTPMNKQAPAVAPGFGARAPAPASVPSSLPQIGQEIPLAPGVQQGLTNQTGMYVTGAQAANPPTVAPVPADAAMSAHMGALKSATDQAAARLARPMAQTNTAQATAEYGALQKTANDLRPSYFSQQTPSSAARLAQAETAANNALWSVYTQQGQPAQAVAAPNPALAGANPMANYTTRMKPDQYGARAAIAPTPVAGSDSALPPAAGKDVGFGVRRIDAPGKSPLFTNVASAADNAALQGRGAISAQNMGAAQGLSDTFAAEGRAAAQKAQYDQEVATAQAINARPIPKDTGGYGLLSKEYQDRRNASFAPPSLVGDKARNAAIIAQGGALDAQALQGVRNEGEAARAAIHEGGFNNRAALQEQGQNTRFGASQEIAKQRLALDNRKADIADTGAQMDNATKKQLQDLNAQILKETDPAKLAVLQEKAQTLTGKYQRPDPAARMTVVPQGSYIDEKSQQVLQRPALVLGPDGQVIGQQQAQQAQRPAGTVSDVGGKKAVWNGSKWIPQ